MSPSGRMCRQPSRPPMFTSTQAAGVDVGVCCASCRSSRLLHLGQALPYADDGASDAASLESGANPQSDGELAVPDRFHFRAERDGDSAEKRLPRAQNLPFPPPAKSVGGEEGELAWSLTTRGSQGHEEERWIDKLGRFIRGSQSSFRKSLLSTISILDGMDGNADDYDEPTEEHGGQQLHSASRYQPQGLDALCNITRFSRKELKIMYRGFKQECPTGIVDKETFISIFQRYFPLGNAEQYATFVFNSFDLDRSGALSFEEFISGLSLLSRGTLDEKLGWIFQLYDVNNDGHISMEEMVEMVHSIYEMLGVESSPLYENSIKEQATRVFLKMDVREKNFITLQDFLSTCREDPHLLKSISSFDTAFY